MRISQPHLATFSAVLAIATLLTTAAGCHSKSAPTAENFIAGLNAHFVDHPECLYAQTLRFPYETSDPAMTKQLNMLVTSQLLTVEEERALHVSRYTQTATGTRAGTRFCYGHRVVTGIDSFTPPAQANGFPETKVSYRYSMEEVPVWAKSDAMRTAFPAMARDVSGTATATATLAATMAGWQVPD